MLFRSGVNYLPPERIRKMAEDLALLPMWYATPNSYVLAASAYNEDFLLSMQSLLELSTQLITTCELTSPDAYYFVPWGWNPALVKHLHTSGVPLQQLPDADTISQLRPLSHRKQAVYLLPRLLHHSSLCGESHYFTDLESCGQYIQSHDRTLLKAPLSGSGKGLNWCKQDFTPQISGWCQHLIKSQGGVEIGRAHV